MKIYFDNGTNVGFLCNVNSKEDAVSIVKEEILKMNLTSLYLRMFDIQNPKKEWGVYFLSPITVFDFGSHFKFFYLEH